MYPEDVARACYGPFHGGRENCVENSKRSDRNLFEACPYILNSCDSILNSRKPLWKIYKDLKS